MKQSEGNLITSTQNNHPAMALFNKAVDRVSDGLEGCSSSQLPALRKLQAMMPRVEALIAALERAATPTQAAERAAEIPTAAVVTAPRLGDAIGHQT